MSEYVSFSQIDSDDPEHIERYGVEACEAADFFHKLDWEGGIDGLMSYGGPEYFPEEVRHLAEVYETALDNLQTAVTEWGKARGVVY